MKKTYKFYIRKQREFHSRVLRLGPSTKHRVLGVIKHGEEVRMLGKEPSQTDSRYFYYKVKTEAGNIGFVWAGRNDEWFVPSTLGKRR